MAEKKQNNENFEGWDAADTSSENVDPVEEENPFGTEFNSDDVVNKKPKPKANNDHVVEDFNLSEGFQDIDDEPKPEQKKSQLLSDDDIKHLMGMGEEARRAVELHQTLGNDDDERESPVIKKEDIKHSKITEEDVQNYINFDEDTRKKLRFNDPYTDHTEEPDDKLPFKDFIMAPRLAGSRIRPDYRNLMPSETLTDSGKRVEISDKLVDPSEESVHKHTSVIINRDEQGDVESIEVFCKCGERTLIKFDYFDENEETDAQKTDSEKTEKATETEDNLSSEETSEDNEAARNEVIEKEEDITENQSETQATPEENLPIDEPDNESSLDEISDEGSEIQDDLESKIADKLNDNDENSENNTENPEESSEKD